jgi:monoterpene epsilon-lactone hydrolase
MENINEERKVFENLGLSYPIHDEVKVNRVVLAGIQNYWFIPSRMVSNEIVILLHGGGFMYGSLQSHQAMVSHLATATGRNFFL